MTWLERLREKNLSTGGGELTKPTKAPFVSFVGATEGGSETFLAEAEDLREAFEERAGTLEHDGGLPRNQAEAEAARMAAIHGLRLEDVQERAGPDWPKVTAEPELLGLLAHAIGLRRIRERGEVPPNYTAITVCSGCGAVPIFAGAPERVDGCPWCALRLRGMSVPPGAAENPPGTGDREAFEL